MPGTVNGWTLAYTAAGGVLAVSGITGVSLSQSVRDILAGKLPAQAPAPAAAGGTAAAGTAPAGNTGAASPSAAANQATAKILAAPYGWSAGQQWADLVSLWNQESGWSTTAVNPVSGATGIPQLNPSSHAVPPGWSSAAVQITWGLAYIASTYGSPSAAWAHEVAEGWY